MLRKKWQLCDNSVTTLWQLCDNQMIKKDNLTRVFVSYEVDQLLCSSISGGHFVCKEAPEYRLYCRDVVPTPQIIFRRHETFVIADLFQISRYYRCSLGKALRIWDAAGPRSQHPQPSSRISLFDRSTVCRCLPPKQWSRLEVLRQESGSSICINLSPLSVNLFQFTPRKPKQINTNISNKLHKSKLINKN